MQYIERFPETVDIAQKRLSEQPSIHPTCRLHKCRVGAWTELGPQTSMIETEFGDYSYIAGDGQIIYSEIGRFCSIATQVRINPGNHPMERVSQHHMTYRRTAYGLAETDDAAFFAWRRASKCVIGHDVWIGHGATIMPGVVVGMGAVVGAGSVVTRDVAPYAIVAGAPARVIRMRFDHEHIGRIARSEWWNWDRATLMARWPELLDAGMFAKGVA